MPPIPKRKQLETPSHEVVSEFPANLSRRGRKKANGLRKPQIKVLLVLRDSKGPASREVICNRANLDPVCLGNAIGSVKPGERATRETKQGYPSLITLGLVEETTLNIVGKKERCYEITESGKKELEKYSGV
jgi:hypothetical protein